MFNKVLPLIAIIVSLGYATQVQAQCAGPLAGVMIEGSSSGIALTATAAVTSNYNGAQISCFPGQGISNDGTAAVTPTGGSSPYTYAWSVGGQTTQTATGLAAGTYMVTVTDNKGCATSTSVTLTGPTEIKGFTCTNATDKCQVNAGEIKVEATGGTGTLNVTWTSSCTPPSGPAQGTPAGNVPTPVPATYTGLTGNCSYSFKVTDANGCMDN
jgi:SprB repeat